MTAGRIGWCNLKDSHQSRLGMKSQVISVFSSLLFIIIEDGFCKIQTDLNRTLVPVLGAIHKCRGEGDPTNQESQRGV